MVMKSAEEGLLSYFGVIVQPHVTVYGAIFNSLWIMCSAHCRQVNFTTKWLSSYNKKISRSARDDNSYCVLGR